MNLKQQKILIALLAVALLAAGAALIFFAGRYSGVNVSGPSKMARAADGTLWVVSGQQLHQLAADGKRLRQISLSDLGVNDVVSGIAVAKNDVAFIAQATPSSVRRCFIAEKKCDDLTPAIVKSAGPTSYAVMLAADDASRRLLITDNAGHRILISDFDGNVFYHSPVNFFRHPNQSNWLSSSEIVIPDTDHRRIVRVAVKENRLEQALGQFPARGNKLTRPGRVRPMDVTRDAKGNWWVLIAAKGMKDADLVRFDNEGNPLARIDLGGDTDPTSIIWWGDAIIVAEPLRARLTRISETASGVLREPFGDAAFQSDLQELSRERKIWSGLRVAGQAICILAPLLACWLLVRLEKRGKTTRESGLPASTANPDSSGQGDGPA